MVAQRGRAHQQLRSRRLMAPITPTRDCSLIRRSRFDVRPWMHGPRPAAPVDRAPARRPAPGDVCVLSRRVLTRTRRVLITLGPSERTSRMPARKGQGQWALGYREPLNPNERAKRDDDGLNVRRRIIDIYQHTGFAGIDPVDLRSRMRWYGLYTQRRAGHTGRAHRDPRTGGPRGRVLHDADPHRRRSAPRRPTRGDRRGLDQLRP